VGPEEYPTIPDQRDDDLIGLEDAEQAKLVVFMAGNQFMAMRDLLAAFQKLHPEIHPIFCETLPPKLELKQIMAGGARFRGRVISVPPDVYTCVSRQGVETLASAGLTRHEDCFIYLRNRLTLMVPAHNPANVTQVQDLARAEVRVSQPDPAGEDIAEYILNMYRQAGGEKLVRTIMEEKRAAGTTLLTTVHHRQTPQRLLQGRADVGPVWATEVAQAKRQGLALDGVEVGPDLDQRNHVAYWACPVSRGRNPQAGQKWLQFLTSPQAREIFLHYGFTPA